MDFYKVVEERRSIRSYRQSTIPKEKISRMVNAAMMSPSWKNNTSYKFILVDDNNKKNQLAETVKNDTEDAARALREAPLTVVVTADPSKSGSIAEREYYLVDSAIAMEHFMLAATAEGYGTCWIASIDEDKIRSILDIPQDYRVVAMTPVGESAENKEHNPKKNIGEYIFVNSWNKEYDENKVRH